MWILYHAAIGAHLYRLDSFNSQTQTRQAEPVCEVCVAEDTW